MTLTFTAHAHARMQRDRVTIQHVYVVVLRGRSQPTWKGRHRWTHEIDGRWLVVVTFGRLVITAFKRR